MSDPLGASYRHCGSVARRAAKNFYYSFLLLPRELRGPMHALYAFFRQTDDIADGGGAVEERRAALASWRGELDAGLATGAGAWPGMPALADAVRRRSIPARYLREVIDGAEMDLSPRRYPEFPALRDYCYKVASVVGLSCLHLWGFRSDSGRAEELGVACGIALQLTNILRDVREDAGLGRVYLPQDELERFGVSEGMFSGGEMTPALRELFRFQAGRAAEYYERAAPLIALIDPAGRPVFRAMVGIYRELLDEIVRRDYDVLAGRVSLPPWRKAAIAWGAWRRGASGAS
jgi:phytoene synthase